MSRELYRKSIAPHNARVAADSGTPVDNVQAAILLARDDMELGSDVKLDMAPELFGYKQRAVSPYLYASKVYSIDGVNDLAQTTANSQPYLDKIAPVEPISLKNVNGDSRFLTHSTINFSETDSWTIELLLNCPYSRSAAEGNTIIIGNGTTSSIVGINSVNGALRFANQSGTSGNGTIKLPFRYGKIDLLTLTANGSQLKVYFNGALLETITVATNMSITSLFKGYGLVNIFYGNILRFLIVSQSLTSERIAYRYALLKTIFPEIPAVQIGTQTWAVRNFEAVSTPMGNAIANVTDNATWASSQTLYDNAYAAQSGTVEQKTYAGVKAAAMWSHYNNDPAMGSTYGKLYNWFAVKLLQMDIDYYNLANPNNVWGWKVPTQSDFQTLSNYLGGDAISGGSLKITDLNFWNTPNTGANNITGFSVLGSGYRDAANGNFFANKTGSWMWTQTNVSSTSSKWSLFYYNNGSMSVDINLNKYGAALRLIKA